MQGFGSFSVEVTCEQMCDPCRKSKVKLILKAQSSELLGEEEQIRA